MRVILRSIVLLIFCVFSGVVHSTETTNSWYEVTIKHGEKPFDFYGSSSLNPSDFIDTLTNKKFIKLENLMFRQMSSGKMTYKSWSNWDKLKDNYIYLNTNNIIAVHPLRAKPNEE